MGIEELKRANWDLLEKDVVARIRLLRAIVQKLPDNELNGKIAKDLLLPCVRLLAEFCQCVRVDDGHGEADPEVKP